MPAPSLIATAASAILTTTPVTAQPLFLPVSFEVAAIFAGALSGGLTAVNRRFDLTGVLALAFVNGLGGGMMRDVLLQNQGIFALQSTHALLAVLAAVVVAMFFSSAAEKLKPALNLVDALSLGLFCLVGADKAIVAGLGPIPAVGLGAITAAGGGVLRDILCNREPEILRRGSLYSLAAIAGSTVYVALVEAVSMTKPIAMLLSAVVSVGLRLGGILHGWESPEPVDLTHRIAAALRRLSGRAGK